MIYVVNNLSRKTFKLFKDLKKCPSDQRIKLMHCYEKRCDEKKTQAEYVPSLVAWAGSVRVNGIFDKGSSATISAQSERLS